MDDEQGRAGAAEPVAAEKVEDGSTSKPRRANAARPFPVFTLERALIIAQAIKDKNAGNPWPPTEVAKAVGIGKKSSALD